MQDLNNLIPFGSGWVLETPYAINDQGKIVGYGHRAGIDEERAFLLTPSPVPEPSTMLLLASGLVGLAGIRRKFRK